MNASQQDLCSCSICPGTGCLCGCRQAAAQTACTCGPQCPCGTQRQCDSSCACAES